jgi:hypothetical protein
MLVAHKHTPCLIVIICFARWYAELVFPFGRPWPIGLARTLYYTVYIRFFFADISSNVLSCTAYIYIYTVLANSTK